MRQRGLSPIRVLIVTVLVAVSALSAVSAGVAAQGTPSDLQGELTFWHGLGTEAPVVTDTCVPMWEEQYPDVALEILQVPFDQLQNKFNTEASAGGGPDVLLGPPDWIGQYVEADIIMPLDDLTGEGFAEEYNEAAVDLFTYEDALYGVPQNINGVALFYNKALIQEPPETTDEMLEIAAQFADQPDTYGLGVFPQFYNNAAYLYGFGGQVLTEDSQSGFDSPETVEWLNWLQEVANAPGVLVGEDQDAIESLFQQGQLAMMFNGPWFLQGATQGIGAENVGVAVLPAVSANDDAPARPFVGASGLFVNSNLDEEQAELAFEFARWFSTECTRILAEEAGQIPAATSVELPDDNPHAAAFMEQYENGVPLPTDPKMSAVWTPADDMLAKVLRGDTAPEQAAEEAAETINQAG